MDFEEHREYDKEGRETYYRNNKGIEIWYKYNEDGSITAHLKSDKGYEYTSELMEEKVKEKVLITTPVFEVVEKEIEGIEFKPVGLNCKDWVTVIAIDSMIEPVCVFVKQTRWGTVKEFTEFVCGTVEEGESPSEAAAREFEEETGMHIDSSRLVLLQAYNPNPAYFNNTMYVYVYKDYQLLERFFNRGKQKLDEHEDCKVFLDRLSNQEMEIRAGGTNLNAYLLLKEYLKD